MVIEIDSTGQVWDTEYSLIAATHDIHSPVWKK
jgi:hypothetical protein